MDETTIDKAQHQCLIQKHSFLVGNGIGVGKYNMAESIKLKKLKSEVGNPGIPHTLYEQLLIL